MPITYARNYTKDFSAPPKHRKHFILFDGTWNDETGESLDGLVTNVVHMKMILRDDRENQIVRYHRGVGNDDDNGRFGNFWKGATGHGVAKIVENAYVRFIQDWESGDEIFIFGFSRGAAAARIFATKLNREGVPAGLQVTFAPRENKSTHVVEQMISSYSLDKSKTHPVNITFLGVWDTVSAFGLYNNFKRFFGLKRKDLFTDHHIAANIRRAVHLLAIDETRNPFVPSLMNHKPGITHEVWFPGVHSDIGGSYAEDNIAKISLCYMLKLLREWVASNGWLTILTHPENEEKLTIDRTLIGHFHFHGHAAGEDLRPIGVQENGKINPAILPKLHRSYLDFCRSHTTYSVVVRRKKKFKVRFQYMPFNVKVLENKFEIVE